MAKKDDLILKANELKLTITGEETNAKLEEMIVAAQPDYIYKSESSSEKSPEKEQMVPLSTVKELIAEAMRNQEEKNKPVKVKKVTEHHAHVWRLNGKWVVNFADRNFDYVKKEKIDPYIKDPIHAFDKYNEQKREREAWIKLIFEDGSTEEIPLNRYIERRTLVYCPIIKREKVDRSYTIGEVEKKKEVGDRNVGTGVMVEQGVEMHAEVFHVKTPEGKTFILPDYVIC